MQRTCTLEKLDTSNVSDVAGVLGLCIEYSMLEKNHAQYKIDPIFFNERLIEIADDEYYLVLLAKKDDLVVGVLIAYIAQFIWSRTYIAQDLVFFIQPNHRSMASEMIRGYEDWARSNSVTEAALSCMSGLLEDKVVKFYKLHGYKEVGSVTRKEL